MGMRHNDASSESSGMVKGNPLKLIQIPLLFTNIQLAANDK
jgi:hypothetical protein